MIRPSGDIFPAPLRARAVGVRPMAAMQRAGTKKAAPYTRSGLLKNICMGAVSRSAVLSRPRSEAIITLSRYICGARRDMSDSFRDGNPVWNPCYWGHSSTLTKPARLSRGGPFFCQKHRDVCQKSLDGIPGVIRGHGPLSRQPQDHRNSLPSLTHRRAKGDRRGRHTL